MKRHLAEPPRSRSRNKEFLRTSFLTDFTPRYTGERSVRENDRSSVPPYRCGKNRIAALLLCGSARNLFAEKGSLSDLNDIVMPEPVSGWPPAPGVWLMLILMAGVVAWFLIRRIIAFRKNAYRRAALAELVQVDTAADMGEILRRVALHARSRETVAALKGEDWFQWLETEGGFQLPEKARLALASVYSNEVIDPTALRQFTEQWIREHTC